MAVKDSIIHGIIQHIENSPPPNGGSWCIGLTCDLLASYGAWGQPAGLNFWEADSLDDAKAIGSYCVHEKSIHPLSDGGI
ncbi:MAG: hypothetical protein AABZ15_06680 [Nitrospirota bacterium]